MATHSSAQSNHMIAGMLGALLAVMVLVSYRDSFSGASLMAAVWISLGGIITGHAIAKSKQAKDTCS